MVFVGVARAVGVGVRRGSLPRYSDGQRDNVGIYYRARDAGEWVVVRGEAKSCSGEVDVTRHELIL